MTEREKLLSEIDSNNGAIAQAEKKLRELYELDEELHKKLLTCTSNTQTHSYETVWSNHL